MSNWRRTSVLILSREKEFAESLEQYLKHDQMSGRWVIRSYNKVDDCLQNLSLDDKEDVVVLNYDADQVAELSAKSDQLRNDFTLILHVPDNYDGKKIRSVKGGVKEYVFVGDHHFEKIKGKIKEIAKENRFAKGFANVNYWLAIIAIIVMIIALVVVLKY